MSWNFTFSSSSSDLACVEVAIRDDSLPELVETFTVTIQPTGPSRLISVQPSEITININNDDSTTVAGVHAFDFQHNISHRCTLSLSSSISCRDVHVVECTLDNLPFFSHLCQLLVYRWSYLTIPPPARL